MLCLLSLTAHLELCCPLLVALQVRPPLLQQRELLAGVVVAVAGVGEEEGAGAAADTVWEGEVHLATSGGE